jgi:hypothetical protein
MEFLSRLPLYLLAPILGVIELLLRTLLGQLSQFEFLPVAIVSAALGFLASLIVHDAPAALVQALTLSAQRVLKIISALAFTLLLLGMPLWIALAAMAMKAGSKMPAEFNLLSLHQAMVLAYGFYWVAIVLTELKARVLR